MNKEEMYKTINKGVPNYVELELDKDIIINECASNKEQLTKEMSLIQELYRSFIIERTGYTKAQEYFFDKFVLRTSYRNAQTNIYISPIPFITKLKKILNVTNESVDYNDETLYKELLDQVERLRHITTPEELEKSFPLIYEDYMLSLSSYPMIKKYEMKYKNTDNPIIKENINRQYRLYNTYGLHTLFSIFMKRQCTLYRNFVVRRQFIEGYTNRNPLDFSMFTGLDKEKFELYLADRYLTRAISTTDDREKQSCIFYLATYIRETKYSDIKIHNDEGIEISFNQIVRRYKKILQQNPIIKPIDEPREHFENYHIKHVENHVKKYFFTDVNWQIIPPGHEDLDERVIESLNRTYNYLSPEERKQKIYQRYLEYERKKQYFENSGYIYKIYGINTFAGYIAFVYENGEILMEKFFDDVANCLPTQGEAIYNLKVCDFETLSRLEKTTLMKEPRCTRIIHRGNWEKKGTEIISRPSTEETKDEVKKLILRLENKRTD